MSLEIWIGITVGVAGLAAFIVAVLGIEAFCRAYGDAPWEPRVGSDDEVGSP